jgi:hypothetical protein
VLLHCVGALCSAPPHRSSLISAVRSERYALNVCTSCRGGSVLGLMCALVVRACVLIASKSPCTHTASPRAAPIVTFRHTAATTAVTAAATATEPPPTTAVITITTPNYYGYPQNTTSTTTTILSITTNYQSTITASEFYAFLRSGHSLGALAVLIPLTG